MTDKFLRWAGWHECAGEWIAWSVFLAEFHKFLLSCGLDSKDWPQERIQRSLGPSMPIGRGPRNLKIVGNVSREFAQPRRWERDEVGNVRLQIPYLKTAS